MGCLSSRPAIDPEPPMREVRATAAPSAPPPPVVEQSPAPLSRQNSRKSTRSMRESTPHREISSPGPPTRKRAGSTPEQPQHVKSPMPEDRRSRVQSTSASRSHRSDSTPPVPELPNRRARVKTMSPPKRSLTSTLQHMLSNNLKFRILVVGKRGSGKSSLINAVFGVDLSAEPETWTPKRDINLGIRPKDNSYLIIHEFSAFEPGDPQGLQSIRDFISYRTDQNRPALERLHAVWICVPAPDAVNKSIGEGVEEILVMRGVPVIVAFTKFDVVVTLAGNRAKASTLCEQSCRDLFRREPKDVPVESVSVNEYRDLIGNLAVTTDRLVTGSRAVSAPSARMSTQRGKPRTSPVPLAWSVAARVSHDISIQASIEVGRSRYWCNLWSNLDFAGQELKDCVDIIHADIVEVWNLNDRNKHLLSVAFKGRMSHIVKDLAEPAGGTSIPNLSGSGDEFADWGNDIYRGSRENVQCVMGYIVDLTVILYGIFSLSADRVSARGALSAMDRHVKSKRRGMIHADIRSFVTEIFGIRFSVQQRDLVLEKTIDLIKQYCVPPSTGG